MRSRLIGIITLVSVVQLAPGGAHAQSTLNCDLRAVNAVGAHAGTLNLRIGIDGVCDAPGDFELVFPGGALVRGSAPSGRLLLTQDAAVCATGPKVVVMRYVSEAGEVWQGSLPITNEDGTPLDGSLECDALLQRGMTALRWEGAAVPVLEAFGQTIPPSLRVIWQSDPIQQRWFFWGAGLPDALQGFSLLVPAVTYWFVNDGDLEIPVRFPF